MVLNWDLDLNQLVISAGSRQALTSASFRLGTIEPLQLRCSRSGVPDVLPSGAVPTFGIKIQGEYEADHLTRATGLAPNGDWSGPVAGDTLNTYTASLDLGVPGLTTVLSPDAPGSTNVESSDVELMAEMSAQVPGELRPRATQNLSVDLTNNVNKGTEPPILGGANAGYPSAPALTTAVAQAANASAAIAGLGTASAHNVGTSPGDVIALDAITGLLPAVDGSQLLNLPDGSVAGLDINPTSIGATTRGTGAFTSVVTGEVALNEGGTTMAASSDQIYLHTGQAILRVPSNFVFCWTPGGGFSGADIGFSRLSPGRLALGNGTAGDVSGRLDVGELSANGRFFADDGQIASEGNGTLYAAQLVTPSLAFGTQFSGAGASLSASGSNLYFTDNQGNQSTIQMTPVIQGSDG